MPNRKYLILLFLFSCSLFRCGTDEEIDPKAPVACFSIVEQNLYAKVGIAFNSDCSKNALSYLWEFGDGEISTSQNPSHIYKDKGTYTVTLKIENDLSQFHTATKKIEVQPSPFIEHSGYIDQAEIWKEGLHLVGGNVYIRHGSLKIEPGAVVHINKEKSIYVGHKDTTTPGGALFTAIGTTAKPIIFKPSSGLSTAGEWGHIFFTEKASASSSIEYAEIRYGGKANATWDYEAWTYYTNYGIVHVAKTGVMINNTLITGAPNYAVSLFEDAYFTSFANNTLSDNANYPIYIHINYAHTIGIGNSIQSSKGIFVHSKEFRQANATWKKQSVPYILDGEKWILSGLDGSANLYIEAGTTIAFRKNASLQVGNYNEGHLFAEGTASQPIVFTSAEENKAKGDWVGIDTDEKCVFRYCRFEYAGGKDSYGYQKALDVSDDQSIISNCTITESAGHGIDIEGVSPTIMENNVISNCNGYGVIIAARHFHQLTSAHTLTNTKGILIESGLFNIEGAVVWPKSPYLITCSGRLNLQSSAGTSLTVAPGSKIHFTTGSGIIIGSDSWLKGTLIADGTSERIIFTIDDASKAKGEKWANILFGAGTTADSKLVNCEISFGGYAPSDPWFGMIDCTNSTSKPTISNCTISNSYGYGISIKNSTPILTNNTFSGNAKDNIYNY